MFFNSVFHLFTNSCKKKCLETLGENNCMDIFTKFYSMDSKNQQDMFIHGLIDVHSVKQRRPRKDSPRLNTASFKYNLLHGCTRVEVCLKAFTSVLDISTRRVRRVRELKQGGKTAEDKRGRFVSYSLPLAVKIKVREHINSFPLKESHYSGEKIFYLSSDLHLKIMHKLYLEKHPDKKVSYSFYRSFFTENFNYRFGRPQVDTCCTCEQLNLKIKSPHLNEVAKRAAVAELLIHKRRSRKFYSALKYESSEDGKKEDNVLSLAFDFMQNISLPKVPVQELFYLRQLTVNVFGICNIKDKTSLLYVYHEGEGKKGPDEVCSFLHDYFKQIPVNITELRLFSDNCPAQNKNQAITRYMLSLTDSGRFKKIQHYFPVRGHSFLPCDRDFGIISRRLRRHEKIFSMHEITEHIILSGKPGKFQVKEVKATDILNFKMWWKNYYKKTAVSEETKHKPKQDKILFTVSSLYQFVYDHGMKGYIKAFPSINGLMSHTFFMRLQRDLPVPPNRGAYPTGRVPIKASKMADFTKLKQYVPNEHLAFYEDILNWPVNNNIQEDE